MESKIEVIHISKLFKSHGHWTLTVTTRDGVYTATTDNSRAIDNWDEPVTREDMAEWVLNQNGIECSGVVLL